MKPYETQQNPKTPKPLNTISKLNEILFIIFFHKVIMNSTETDNYQTIAHIASEILNAERFYGSLSIIVAILVLAIYLIIIKRW